MNKYKKSSTNIKKTRIFAKELTSQGTVQESSPSWRDAPCKSMNIIFGDDDGDSDDLNVDHNGDDDGDSDDLNLEDITF